MASWLASRGRTKGISCSRTKGPTALFPRLLHSIRRTSQRGPIIKANHGGRELDWTGLSELSPNCLCFTVSGGSTDRWAGTEKSSKQTELDVRAEQKDVDQISPVPTRKKQQWMCFSLLRASNLGEASQVSEHRGVFSAEMAKRHWQRGTLGRCRCCLGPGRRRSSSGSEPCWIHFYWGFFVDDNYGAFAQLPYHHVLRRQSFGTL
jgi:hypothetical protein